MSIKHSEASRREFMRISLGGAIGVALSEPLLGALPGTRSQGQEDLFQAIAKGDLAGVRQILSAFPELAVATDSKGRSAFVLSHVHGQPTIAKEILDRGIELDVVEAVLAQDQDRFIGLAKDDPTCVNALHPIGGSAYFAAARYGRADMIWPLNRWAGSPNAASRGLEGMTAFRAAFECKDKATAKNVALRILVDAGDPNTQQRNNDTVLHGAAAFGDAEIVRAIIRRGGDVSIKNKDGETALDVAERLGHEAAADVLRTHESIPRMHVSSRFSYDASGEPYKVPSALSASQLLINEFGEVCHYSLEAAKKLFNQYPDVIHGNATWNELGVEACAHMEKPSWTRYFLDQGAPMSLATALAINDIDAARRLLDENESRVHERGPHDFALMWYPQIAGGIPELAELILEYGGDVNEEKMGTCCLHRAAYHGQKDLVVFLLENGADVTAEGRSDFSALRGTPLDWAQANNQTEISKILRDHGAKPAVARD